MENKEMTLQEAVRVLHQVAELAQKAGILSMQDAALTFSAVNITTKEILTELNTDKKSDEAIAEA